MSQIIVQMPDEMVSALDAAAAQLKLSRTEIIHDAMERYLQDCEDLALALERLQNPDDQVIDWNRAKHELLNSD
ncbi:MAG: ribbon-helix-helix protein, CopG family [Acidimicrobiaceae bacterium]|nr:ribbon-helix-helix protein, CopG family [Acidimicrobiaceae bacterium]